MTDFQKWARKNSQTLRKYSSDQVAWFALANGFTLEEACGGTTDHFVHLKRLLNFWESPLMSQWIDLCSYERGHDL